MLFLKKSKGLSVLDEVNDGEGITQIQNLTSQKGSILLTTARDTEIDILSAVKTMDMTVDGNVSVKDLILKASGDADIQADQSLLHVTDAAVAGNFVLGNSGEVIIDRLAALMAEITTVGNLTIVYVDTDRTEVTAHVTEGLIDILARGDLILTETSDSDGETQIKRLESETGSLTVTTSRNTVIEEIRTPEDLDIVTEGHLDILHGEGAGIISLKAEVLKADFEGDLNAGRIEADSLYLNIHKGSLFNGRNDDEVNLIAREAVVNVDSGIGEDDGEDDPSIADIGRGDKPFCTDIAENGKLSITADGDVYLEDICEEGQLILSQIITGTGNVVLTAKRPVVIGILTADTLQADISNGTLSLNTSDDLKMILTGEDNRLGNLKVEGALDIISDGILRTEGVIQAESTRFAGMEKLMLQIMASMGEVTIVSREDGQTEIYLKTTEADEILRFMANLLEIQTGSSEQKIVFVNVPGNLTLENPGGHNIYEIYTLYPETEILSGQGNDVYYIGMLCDEDNPEAVYEILWKGEKQWMSHGNLSTLDIQDAGGENTFHIQHTENRLNLHNSPGDDTYILAGYYIWDEENQMYHWYWALEDLWIEDMQGNNTYIGFPASYFGINSDGVATGDGTPTGLLMLLMLLSGMTMLWSFKKKKQRQ